MFTEKANVYGTSNIVAHANASPAVSIAACITVSCTIDEYTVRTVSSLQSTWIVSVSQLLYPIKVPRKHSCKRMKPTDIPKNVANMIYIHTLISCISKYYEKDDIVYR